MHDPFHPGERAIQERVGERDVALMNGQLIADRIPAAARLFVSQQQYCVLGWSSPNGDLWAEFLTGPQGFARTDEEQTTLHLRRSHTGDGDSPTSRFDAMRAGDPLGALFVELSTRRRLRVNGRIAHVSQDEIALTVEQAYPLCPKYIQRRELHSRDLVRARAEVREGVALNDELASWIARADTFFVASARPGHSADVSHRGGKSGFVQLHNGVLRVPDYPGNSMFNTLGNFEVNPHAGLVFLDFATHRQLQMTGDIRLDLDAGIENGKIDGTAGTGGTGRWWEFTPRRWIVSPLSHAFAWSVPDPSPFNP